MVVNNMIPTQRFAIKCADRILDLPSDDFIVGEGETPSINSPRDGPVDF